MLSMKSPVINSTLVSGMAELFDLILLQGIFFRSLPFLPYQIKLFPLFTGIQQTLFGWVPLMVFTATIRK